MKSNTVVNGVLVIVGFLLAFGAGYLLFGKEDTTPKEAPNETAQTEEQQEEETDVEDVAMEIPEEAQVLSRNGCIGCHSVESMDVVGGDIGPDLSRAFPEMKGKHGKELNDFLQEPTAAVMATVLGEDPLDDDEREQIVEVLKTAAEKRGSPTEDETDDETKDENSEETEK